MLYELEDSISIDDYDTEELWDMVSDGVVPATDGCDVEPDGTCPHGCPSILLEAGLI